jgi:glycosyltransferase involved in cell wall biosynthesis
VSPALPVEPSVPHASAPPLSIVIPTFDSARTIGACLASVVAQARAEDEIIIVDDVRTSDETRVLARDAGARVLVSPAGMAESRNIGFATARNDRFLSLDADMRIGDHLLDTIRGTFVAGADAVTIRERDISVGRWARARRLDKEVAERTGTARSARAFTRTLFDLLRGYDPTLLAGEDFDLHRRLLAATAQIQHISDPWIDHDEGWIRLIDVARKKYRYGQTVHTFDAKHGAGTLRRGLRLDKRLGSAVRIGLNEDPAAVPGFLVLKSVEITAGMTGMLLSRVRTVRKA